MSATRSTNLQPQQRLDISSIKLIESASNYDLDLLAGISLAGKVPVIFKGLILNTSNAIGLTPSLLSVQVSNSVIWHYLASESGTVFQIGADVADEVLSDTNPNVSGTFSSGTNYIGLDLYKVPDSDTSDTVAFKDADENEEFTQTIPLARILKYKLVITTQPFSVMTHLLPIAKVFVANGLVSEITDARNMMFRLGSGGDNPDANYSYGWGTRTENPITIDSNSSGSPFLAEDKNINSLKAWSQAIMSSIWEIRGGTKWYSQQHRDHVKLSYGQPVLANGDNFWFLNGVAVTAAMTRVGTTVTLTLNNHPFTVGSTFELNSTDTTNFPSGTKTVTAVPGINTIEYQESGAATTSGAGSTIINTVAWTGIVLLFENSSDSSIYKNTITSASIVIPDKYAIYADLDRSQNATISLYVKPLYLLGGSTIPGRRMIIGWRNSTEVFSRDRPYEVGRTFQAATTTALGIVKINNTAGAPAAPVVPVIMADGEIQITNTVAGSTKYAALLTGANSATTAVQAASGLKLTGGNATVGNANGGSAVFATSGNGVGTGIDGSAYFFARNSPGIVGVTSGAGAGGAFAGTSGFLLADLLGLFLSTNPKQAYFQNSGIVAMGQDSPAVFGVGRTLNLSNVVNYSGGFGGYFIGGNNYAGIVNEVSGNAPGIISINRSGAAITLPSVGYNQYLYTNVTTGFYLESAVTSTDPTATIVKTTTNANSTLLVLSDESAGVGLLIKNNNTGGTGARLDVPSGDAFNIINGDARLASTSNKIVYSSAPTYTGFASIQDASFVQGVNWGLIMNDPRFIEGCANSTAGASAASTLTYRIRIPKKATITNLQAYVYQGSGVATTIKSRVFTMDHSGGTRVVAYLNAGGAAGDNSASIPNATQTLVTLSLAGSHLMADSEELYVGIGANDTTANTIIGGIKVTYTIPEITGTFS